MPAVGPRRDRIVQLDALRGVAAVWVMLYHYTIQYSGDFGHGPGVWRVAYGQRAVELFFMISGFVIPMTLDRTKRPMDFVVSRFSRLYPSFWACLIITTVLTACFGLPGASITAAHIAANVTMIPQLAFHQNYIDQSYWTLEVELLFYVLAFAGWWLRGLRGVAIMVSGLTVLALAEGLARRAGHRGLGGLADALLLQYFIMHFACGFGVYLVRLSTAPLAGAAMLALGMSAVLARNGVDSLCVTLALSTAMLAASFDGIPGLSCRPLLFLGAISYPLYLLHQNIGYIVIRAGYSRGQLPNVNISLAIIISLALGTAVSILIERPAMRWIRGWYQRPAR